MEGLEAAVRAFRYGGARPARWGGGLSWLPMAIMGILASAVALAEAGPFTGESALGAALAPDAAPKADEIVIGAYVNDIQELDFRTHSYAVDLYIWFRWRNKDLNPAKSMEFMNRVAPDDHVRELIYEEPKLLPDGSFYAVVRNQGRFSSKLRLENYPFDRQDLRIEIEDAAGGIDKQAYVPDSRPVTMMSAIVLPGFRIGPPQLIVRANAYPTNFGDPTVGEEEAYSRATILVPIERPLTALSVKTFLPILLIMACAGLVLFIRPAFIDARVGLGITALLTLVALQLAGGSSLPEVDYLTMVDKVYLASYGVIMLVLLRVVRSSWREEGGERAIARSDRLWFELIAVLYAATLAGIGAQALGTEWTSRGAFAG